MKRNIIAALFGAALSISVIGGLTFIVAICEDNTVGMIISGILSTIGMSTAVGLGVSGKI